MNRNETLRKILEEEYGITSEEDLDQAIKKQRRVDITAFCIERKRKGEQHE